MAKIIGAFVFEDLGDGCLTGKWLNNDELSPYPESAKLKKTNEAAKALQSFEGIYTTSWIQEGDKVEHTNLIIRKLSSDIYELEWSSNNKLEYNGRGMLYKGMLIGTYWI